MITNTLLLILNMFLQFTAWALPDWQIPDLIIDTVLSMSIIFKSWSIYFPFDTIIELGTLAISFELIILTINISSGIIGMLRGSGSIKL